MENELVQCSGNFLSIFSLKPAFFRQVFQTLIYEQTNFLIRTCNKVIGLLIATNCSGGEVRVTYAL